MFDELEKYKNKGHFFFMKESDLKEVSKDVPDLPGVFYVFRLAGGRIDLVYIDYPGGRANDNPADKQSLRERINGKHGSMTRQEFFERKMAEEQIEGLDIYWVVTHDGKHKDAPSKIARKLIQRHLDIYGELPVWNNEV